MASIGKSPPPAKHPEQLGSHEARDNTTDTRDTGDAIEAAGPTSTPLPDAGHVSGPSEPARIRRNTACVRCRDAKVRCNASTATGRPCLRCSKLELQCVVDKSHKRTSRRSKLEELAAEVQNIKEAVAPRALVDVPSGLAPARRASLPPPALSSVPAQLPSHGPASYGPRTAPPPAPPPEQHYIPAPSSAGAFKFGRPRPFSISGETAIPPSTPVRPNDVLSAGSAVQLAEPRALGSRVFSGEDIDYYFEKYFEHFHAYLPIVRTRDPDTCYRRGPVLFWAIIMTACRRFARDDTAFQFLIDSLLPLIWCSVSQPPLHLSIINAILLLATWPFPTIRFLTDPSLIFAGIAMNSSFLTGLHTGRGSHSEFKSAMHELDTTDEEATFTWVGCAVISHRVSAYMGCPSASSLFNKTVDDLLDGRSQFSLPRYFYLHLETSRFANRVNRTMCASLEESHGVSHHLVAYMEEEYAKVQRLLYPDNSDLDNFTLLSTLLEIQTYYFMPLPGYSEELLKRNVIKCYCTAEELIHSATRLHRETAFLHYAPHFVFRTLLSSICVVMSVHLSSYTKGFQADTVGPLIKEALRAIRICSVQDNDLHVRCGGMLEKYWEMKAHIPRSDSGVSVYTHRLGASLTFDCLRRWKKDVEQARDANGLGFANGGSVGISGANFPEGHEVIRESFLRPPPWNRTNVAATEEGPRPGPNADLGLADPFQRFDWNAFMDDFDWSFTSSNLLGSSANMLGFST